MKLNKYWFKPKRYGYGATPITWEGWVLVLLFVLYLIGMSFFINARDNYWQFMFYVVLGIIVIGYISKIKTKEDWHWRWG